MRSTMYLCKLSGPSWAVCTHMSACGATLSCARTDISAICQPYVHRPPAGDPKRGIRKQTQGSNLTVSLKGLMLFLPLAERKPKLVVPYRLPAITV